LILQSFLSSLPIHEPTPNFGVKVKRIMHNVFPVGCAPLDYQITFPIVLFQNINWSILPWFIDWFQT
jgi:hypothetical protein